MKWLLMGGVTWRKCWRRLFIHVPFDFAVSPSRQGRPFHKRVFRNPTYPQICMWQEGFDPTCNLCLLLLQFLACVLLKNKTGKADWMPVSLLNTLASQNSSFFVPSKPEPQQQWHPDGLWWGWGYATCPGAVPGEQWPPEALLIHIRPHHPVPLEPCQPHLWERSGIYHELHR